MLTVKLRATRGEREVIKAGKEFGRVDGKEKK